MTTSHPSMPRLILALILPLLGALPAGAQLTDSRVHFGTRVLLVADLDASGGVSEGDRVTLETWLRRDAGADCFPGTLAVRLVSTVGLEIDESSWREVAADGLTRILCDCESDTPGRWSLAFLGNQPTDFRIRWESVVSGPLPPVVTTQWRSDLGYLKNRVIFLGNPAPAPPGWVDELAWGDWLAARAAQVVSLEDDEMNRALARYVALRADRDAGERRLDCRSARLGDPIEVSTRFVDPPAEPPGFDAEIALETIVTNSPDGGEADLDIDLADPAVAGFTVDPQGFAVTGLSGAWLESSGEAESPGRFRVRLPPGGLLSVRWRGTTAPWDAAVFTPAVTVRVRGEAGALNLPFYPKSVVGEVPAQVAAADQVLARIAQVDPLEDPVLVDLMIGYLAVRGFQRSEPSDIGYDADGNGD